MPPFRPLKNPSHTAGGERRFTTDVRSRSSSAARREPLLHASNNSTPAPRKSSSRPHTASLAKQASSHGVAARSQDEGHEIGRAHPQHARGLAPAKNKKHLRRVLPAPRAHALAEFVRRAPRRPHSLICERWDEPVQEHLPRCVYQRIQHERKPADYTPIQPLSTLTPERT